MITVKFFGWARDIAHCAAMPIAWQQGMDGTLLWKAITESCPEFAGRASKFALAVNWEYMPDSVVIHDGDEVAVIPPVSGG